MNSVDKVLEIASGEVGYLEKKDGTSLYNKTANAGSKNFTKYWDTLNKDMQGEPWCQCFVNWCFYKAYGSAAKSLLCTSGGWSYYTPTAAGYFKTKQQWKSSNPKAGDIVYFKNAKRIYHVGIVERVSSGIIYTIEGNTSSTTGVVANGGGVFRKSYKTSNSKIAGYGRPNYDMETFEPHWEQNGADWYYRISENQNAHGWQKIKNADGKTRWYYFQSDGKMAKGWITISGKKYYLEETGDFAGACYISNGDGAQEVWVVR